MDKITHEVRLEQWKHIISECLARPEGQTAKQWLTEKGISEKTYYYWQRRVRKEAYALAKKEDCSITPATAATVSDRHQISFAAMSFHPISETPLNDFVPAAVIRRGGMVLELSNAVSDRLLERILEVATNA